ncbi:2-succinyl-6-hydroxy-2,4-cyclohexadiene-1-carboxylate synthase [Bacillus pakistanensis]|uniref:Putative 2-succinyl-6-hydroxy-2,4-cyclohexadiene-1-carboxylate synthase n=1 Tax=Rossellomorea pakistanensis TaxID=992288 RepID=A0ABS2NKG2_9BACI|nr:2-succinyl-6-hydroxy-2,4-cyclohexadiene-1-carboxylate synthase [Bacillus pakistanensis]MBM7588352.1 2-succinyl-6-hydroxy-2,4-cyclohexadiene-1-carboxylate synthase [Bacillus pakistanensis]
MFIMANGVKYYVEEKGSGTPLLFLHGFTGDTSTWSDNVERLSKNFSCITIDIIGHGKTDSPAETYRYSMRNSVEDIRTILDTLSIKKISILGYSMGGRLALAFAVQYPEYIEKLILESASPGLKTEKERKLRIQNDHKLADKLLNNGIIEFINFWENIPLFSSQKKLSSSVQEKIRKQRLNQNPLGLANSLKGMGAGEQPSYWGELYKFPFPVLLIVGEYDEKFCLIAEEMMSKIGNAHVFKVQEAGHAIHVEKPEKFGTMIEELFLLHKRRDP